ncbi:hypothetical protein [Mycobacterium sp.]|uniref:hypothetical protein n=1 Tax=Mycobacterium sp. TaxID=1785 RepID=UPI0031D98EC5
MGHRDPALTYDELLDVFKSSLGQALSGHRLPHDSAILNVTVLLTLLDVANAARQRRPTEGLVTRATEAFAAYAADFATDDAALQPFDIAAGAARSSAVRSMMVAN